MNREFIVLTRKGWKIFYRKIFFVAVLRAHVHRVELPLLIQEMTYRSNVSKNPSLRVFPGNRVAFDP